MIWRTKRLLKGPLKSLTQTFALLEKWLTTRLLAQLFQILHSRNLGTMHSLKKRWKINSNFKTPSQPKMTKFQGKQAHWISIFLTTLRKLRTNRRRKTLLWLAQRSLNRRTRNINPKIFRHLPSYNNRKVENNHSSKIVYRSSSWWSNRLLLRRRKRNNQTRRIKVRRIKEKQRFMMMSRWVTFNQKVTFII